MGKREKLRGRGEEELSSEDSLVILWRQSGDYMIMIWLEEVTTGWDGDQMVRRILISLSKLHWRRRK